MQAIRAGMVLLIAVLGAWALDSTIQAQEKPSVAEAARRAREQKQSQPKSKQVWTNDNIPTTPGTISVVGKASQPAPTPEATAESSESNQKTEAGPEGKPANAAPAAEADKKAEEQAAAEAELAKAKERLASLRTDLDLLQREYNLEQQTYYSRPDFASDKDGKAKLDALAQQVEAKQQEVQQAEQQVSELEQKSRPEQKTEGPPSS